MSHSEGNGTGKPHKPPFTGADEQLAETSQTSEMDSATSIGVSKQAEDI